MNKILESCSSTNDVIRSWENPTHGDWIAAREQTAGRGRHDRKWTSNRGNLHFSIYLELRRSPYLTWLPIQIGISLCEILRDHGYPAQLVWPNDLILKRGKVGGILCESVMTSTGHCKVIAGIGLNVRTSPQGLDQETSCLHEFGDRFPTVESLIQEIVPRLSKLNPPASLSEIHALRSIFWSFSLWQRGESINRDGIEGILEELGDQGELRLKTRTGIKELFA